MSGARESLPLPASRLRAPLLSSAEQERPLTAYSVEKLQIAGAAKFCWISRQSKNLTRLRLIGEAEYSAYEDMGAMLHGFIRFQNGDHKTPLRGVLEHSPGNIVLDKLFNRYSIATPDDLYRVLRFEEFIPGDWPYTSINLEKVLKTMCRFMVEECRKNQQSYGIDAYNRIKHNLAFVPNGKRYQNQLPFSPAVLIPNPTPSPAHPYALLGIPMDDKALEARCDALASVDATLRALASLYVLSHHAEFLRTARHIDPPSKLLDVPPSKGY